MNTNVTLSPQVDFVMPIYGSGLVAAVRALPWGTTSMPAADSKRRFVDTTGVWGYVHITDVAVANGAFPGTSAWSPPI